VDRLLDDVDSQLNAARRLRGIETTNQ
jgi:hypothetical protein